MFKSALLISSSISGQPRTRYRPITRRGSLRLGSTLAVYCPLVSNTQSME
ncbi:hypothetical protein RchiOBHm_Chr5g0019621 [Rosa chinensis]|uniref:Uncharacterized protein n=1 Tax=Rosa chinensis TaxID=74649 RepID=A0A2P6Q711_ROSCH|nr:hypothetical protein RchiOBHm_Chr5g0019621 [Rosa chinensis]